MGLFENFPPRKPDIICEAIRDGRWHGDNGPKWTEGRKRRPSPSAADVEAARRQVVKLLKRHERCDPLARALRRKIMKCRPKSPCVSLACPSCMRAAQRFFVRQVTRFLRVRKTAFVNVTVIPDLRFEEGQLPSSPFQYLDHRLGGVMRTIGVQWAIWGFDLSLNYQQGNKSQAQPHAWGIGEAGSMRRAEEALHDTFRRDPVNSPKPVHFKQFDGSKRGIAYGLKRNFYRRETIPAGLKKDGTHRRRNTRERDLLAHQRVEVMLAMDALGFEGRVLLHGLEFRRTEKGWRLVMLGEKPS